MLTLLCFTFGKDFAPTEEVLTAVLSDLEPIYRKEGHLNNGNKL